jgi:hypothetical protein
MEEYTQSFPAAQKKELLKMKFHFIRTQDADITVGGNTIAECTQRAFDERMKQVTPVKIQGEVIE